MIRRDNTIVGLYWFTRLRVKADTQFKCAEEEISDVNIKVYYQQIAIIVFTICAIFRGEPGGRIKWARGPHAAPGPHVGQLVLYLIKASDRKLTD